MTKWVAPLDKNFETRYLEAERAYASERFDIARQIAMELFQGLDDSPDIPSNQEAKDHWRAFLALLLGNVHFFGLNETDQAAEWYRQVLSLQPDETLRDLAKQGLQQAQARSVSAPTSVQAAMVVESGPKLTELINDPFLSASSASGSRTITDQPSTAMPWLDEMDPTPEKPPTPVSPLTTVAEPTPSAPPQPFPSPELEDTPRPTPELSKEVRTTPEVTDQQPSETETTTQDPQAPPAEAMEDVLEGASLRIRVRPHSNQSETDLSEQTERLSWLKQLRLWSGRR